MTASLETIYFHGLPGSGAELQLFGPEVQERTNHFRIAQRQFPNAASEADIFKLITDEMRSKYNGQLLRLVGFSLGASTALRVAALLGPQVEKIDIISAAAPLQSGNYLEKMAGAPVFRIAQKNRFAFNVLSRCQSTLSKVTPKLLYSMLFSSAKGNDIELREDPYFRAQMVEILKKSLGNELATYRAEISEYVSDWSETLGRVSQPVSIYHGALDNWSPVEMARDIKAALGSGNRLEVFENCSHYSTLREFLKRVGCPQLGR